MKLTALILSVLFCNICFAQVNCDKWVNLQNRFAAITVGDLDVTGNQITVEASFNMTGPSVNIVSKHLGGGDANYLLRPVRAEIVTDVSGFVTTDQGASPCNDVLEFNKTYHVALVYDGSTLKFYRNGALISEVPATGNLVTNNWNTAIGEHAPVVTPILNGVPNPDYHNQDQGQGYYDESFRGFINEVRIWNVARTQEEIKAYTNTSLPNPPMQNGLLGYWVFNSLQNLQGNTLFNGTIEGLANINQTNTSCNFIPDSCGVPLSTPCSNWLNTPSSPSYTEVGQVNITGNKITVEAVFNRTSSYSGGELYAGDLVSKHNTTTDVNYLLRPNSAEITTTNGYFRTPDICEIELNKTYHVSMVYNGATLKFYRNGFLMSQVAATGNLVQNSWKTRIGFYEPQAANTNFIGFINEVRIWNVEKSQTEIQSYMNTSLPNPATQPGLVAYYIFDDLLNKQGNALYNGVLEGSASINAYNPVCSLIVDSCKILSQPQTCNGSLGAPVVNITFGNGANNPGPELSTTVPGATTNYNYANYATGTPPSVVFDGDYALVNQVPLNGAWYYGSPDHTGDPNGYMAFFNAAPNPGEFYKQTVLNLCSGTTYEFAAWVTNVVNPAQLPNGVPPNITFNILDANTQAVLATYNTGDIAATNFFTWKQYSLLFTLPPGISSVTLVLNNNNIGGTVQIGNDLAIDDITFKPCGPLTNASFSNTVILDSTGTTNCNTINLFGKITGSFNSPSYQWQVSKDGGNTYSNITGATALSATYSNLVNGEYIFRILSAEAGNINSVNCRFISNLIKLSVIGCNTQGTISKIINDYTPVIALNPCTNKLTVEDASKYNAGDTVLIIQMKGAVIDSSNTASFGTVTNYKNAGNNEFNYVKSKAGNIIELKNILTRQYDVPNGKVQLIRVPYFKTTIVSDTLTCLAWDGKKGGVLVLNVKDTLLLNNSIDVSGKGFRKGIMHNSLINSFTCGLTDYFYPINTIYAAGKGESIADVDSTKNAGWGAKASGGGGGMDPNTGGGGGGNGGIGGIGGFGYGLCANYTTIGGWGLGGNGLTYNSVSNKFFLGGAGGAGHCNNGFDDLLTNTDFDGGNGGGMVLISAPVISGNGNSIISNGDKAYELTAPGYLAHDGMGGGGAGGTILIKANSFITGLEIKVNGGKGGDMSSSISGGKVGPGGGGAGGVAWFSQNTLPPNVTVQKNGGLNGVILDDSNNPYGATAGSDGINVFNLSFSTATVPFKINIDSVRINTSSNGCNSFNLNGIAFVNTAAINKWEWFFDDGTTASQQSTNHSYNTTGSHPVKLVVTDINGCSDSVTTDIIADALPANPTYVITQPTCANSFGSINISNPTGANFQYSIDGTNYQVSPLFSNLPVRSYNLTVKNIIANCISLPINLSINAASLPAAATNTVIQPSCTNPSGTINVTAPLAPDLQYSIDGTNYQTSTTFTNVAAGLYNLTVKNTTSTCVSLPTNVTIDPPLTAPATPSSTITQPVCSNQDVAITVTAPLGVNLQYSIDDINYQAATNFNNVVPGIYRLSVKNTTTNCISLPASISIITGTGTPASPTAVVSIQPDCIVTTGTATVSTPLGNNYQYSFDGSTFQAGTTFTNLAPGSYNVIVKDIVNGCISTATPLTVNAIPLPPAAPLVNTLQPTCAITTGSIIITSPTGNDIEYSINGTAYQAGVSFTGLAPASYSFTAKNVTTQCISSATIAVVDIVPSPPQAPTIGDIIQPSCTSLKGTINISAPVGSNLEYSINGSGYQSGTSFTNLGSGTYNFAVRNTATSCISSATAATIDPLPVLPPVPVASVTVQPSCIISAGTIVISSPAGSNYLYSIDDLQYQSDMSYTGLAPKTYNVTVKDESTGCISSPSVLTVRADINAPGRYLIPTAFSPNRDGINECFGIKYWGVVTEFQLIIYNRWGQTVFSTSNVNDCWDGVYKGVTASQGNYVYYIKAKTLCGPVEKRGNVLLIR